MSVRSIKQLKYLIINFALLSTVHKFVSRATFKEKVIHIINNLSTFIRSDKKSEIKLISNKFVSHETNFVCKSYSVFHVQHNLKSFIKSFTCNKFQIVWKFRNLIKSKTIFKLTTVRQLKKIMTVC